MASRTRPSLPNFLVLIVVMSLSACNDGSSQPDIISDLEVNDLPPMEPIDLSNGPYLFSQNLYTSTIPTRIESATRGGALRTTREISYSSSTRTLSEVSVTTNATTNFPASERLSRFNEFGQLISETLLSNGSIIETTDYEYTDGLLVREDVRFEIDGDVIQTRTLSYDDAGRLVMAETSDPSNAEVLETASRVYSESGWISTVRSGEVTTTITTELNENQQVARFTSVTSAGAGSITRTTAQTFDENDQRLTRRRFKQNDLLVETRYSDFITIDGFIHDRLYQWDVFFDATEY